MASRLIRAALATVLGLTACASGPPVGPDDAVLKRSELDALRATAVHAAALEARVTELEATRVRLERERDALALELLTIAQRAGRAPFRTSELTPASERVRFVDAQRIEAPSAPARRGSFAREAPGRPLVVAFWATWCKPCIADEELALLQALRADLARHDAGFVSVAIDGLDKVRAHPRAERFLYPLWQRDQAPLEMLSEAFVRERGLDMPLFLVVSPAGQLRWFRAGQLNPAAVRDLVTAAVLSTRP